MQPLAEYQWPFLQKWRSHMDVQGTLNRQHNPEKEKTS